MDDGSRFLILSLNGEGYALPVATLQEITVPRGIRRDPKLAAVFEGKIEYRGRQIAVLNIKKVLHLDGSPGSTLLVVKSSKGLFGVLVDDVVEIMNTDQKPAPLPVGVLAPGMAYYRGVLRHKESLALLLNEEGLQP